jgi:hypothetical protein
MSLDFLLTFEYAAFHLVRGVSDSALFPSCVWTKGFDTLTL